MTRTTPPERARLAAALRDLRTRTGLSMKGLAEQTAFSKSSWERYLNGRIVPPREAVRELCRLAAEPEGRCLALWELAESEWSGRSARTSPVDEQTESPSTAPDRETGPETESDPGSGSRSGSGSESEPGEPGSPRAPRSDRSGRSGHSDRSGHRTTIVAVLASVCAVVVAGVTVALFLLPDHGSSRASPSAPASPSPSPSAAGARCRGAACEGGDPMAMNCGPYPQTLASFRTTSGAMLEMRHSDACGATWARMWATRIGDRLTVTLDGAPRSAAVGVEIEDAADAEAYVYTPMTASDSGAVVRACFRAASGGPEECFEGRVR